MCLCRSAEFSHVELASEPHVRGIDGNPNEKSIRNHFMRPENIQTCARFFHSSILRLLLEANWSVNRVKPLEAHVQLAYWSVRSSVCDSNQIKIDAWTRSHVVLMSSTHDMDLELMFACSCSCFNNENDIDTFRCSRDENTIGHMQLHENSLKISTCAMTPVCKTRFVIQQS